jgi:hypothetical protein
VAVSHVPEEYINVNTAECRIEKSEDAKPLQCIACYTFWCCPSGCQVLGCRNSQTQKRKCKTFREGKTVPSAVCNLVVAKVEEMGLFF